MAHPPRPRIAMQPINGDAQPPPAIPGGPGAFDLGVLKDRAPQTVREEAFAAALVGAQLVCQCGERLRNNGKLLLVRKEDMVPSPQGNLPGLGPVVVHSLDCELYRAVQNDPGLTIVAIREVTAVKWTDEPDDDAGTSAAIDGILTDAQLRARAGADEEEEDYARTAEEFLDEEEEDYGS